MLVMIALDRAPRRTALALLVCLLLSGCAQLDRFVPGLAPVGEIHGRVEPSGKSAGKAGRTAPTVDATPRVWVYLEPVSPPARQRTRRPVVEVAIRDGRQEPELQFLNPDQPLRFRNSDTIFHELFTGDTRDGFEVRLKGGELSDSIRLTEPGFVRAFCRLHPHETYSFIVSEARRLVALDARSRFVIPEVRAGEYRIRAASVEAESEGVRVWIDADRTTKLTLKLLPRSVQ
jgi:hypothetical protein